MITVRRHSFQNGKRDDNPSNENFSDVTEALLHIASLIRAGGTVSTNRGRICVTTIRGDRTDEAYYKGNRDEMEVISNFVHLTHENHEDAPSLLVHPELMQHLLSSEPSRRMNIAALIACGVSCPVEVSAHEHHTIEDLIAAAGLFRNGDCATISEALETLAA